MKLKQGRKYKLVAKYSREVITRRFVYVTEYDGYYYGSVNGVGTAYPTSHFELLNPLDDDKEFDPMEINKPTQPDFEPVSLEKLKQQCEAYWKGMKKYYE